MQLNKSKLIVTLIFVLVLTSMVYAEPTEEWKGYGLYTIGSSKISIVSEDVSVELLKDRLNYSGEFVIRNTANEAIKATIGIPVQGIEKITLYERNTSIKYKIRTLGSLQNEFGLQGELPKEGSWYVFSITLNPNESKLYKLSFEAARAADEQNAYSFTYFNDRNLGFSNQVEKSSLYIDIFGFQPYNILSLEGMDAAQLGIKGAAFVKKNAGSASTIYLKYADIDKSATEKLLVSAMYKPKEIANAFIGANYNKVPALCDDYLKNPLDSQISQEQIQYVKAESYRKLQYSDRYLSLVEAMDYSKLYPAALKYKVIYDRMVIYHEQGHQDKLAKLYQELERDDSPNAKILLRWVNNSGLFASVPESEISVFNPLLTEPEKPAADADSKLQSLYKQAMAFKYTPVILFAMGLVLGLVLKKFRIKRRRKKSMYLYRM